jgi:hypothetical protein
MVGIIAFLKIRLLVSSLAALETATLLAGLDLAVPR